MRVIRILAALFIPGSGHFAAGRFRRGAAWAVALTLPAFGMLWWLGFAVVAVVLRLASAVDAALIKVQPAGRGVGAQLLAIVVTLCCYVLLATGLRGAWSEAFRIPSGAMIPTLQVGDHILVDKRARTPARGDVIVFIYPKEPDKDFIKRVVAVGGDTVEIKDNVVWINGQPVPRRHIDGPCEYEDFLEDSRQWETRRCEVYEETLDGHHYRVVFDRNSVPRSTPPRTVPAGEYWVFGDNRDNSHDSRYWGGVPASNVKGTARRIWMSTGPDGIRWGRINQPVR